MAVLSGKGVMMLNFSEMASSIVLRHDNNNNEKCNKDKSTIMGLKSNYLFCISSMKRVMKG